MFELVREDIQEEDVRKVEAFVILLAQLCTASSLADVILDLTAFINSCTRTSVTARAVEIIKQLYYEDVSPQGAEEYMPKWLTDLKELKFNWKLLRKNDGFEHISKLLSICVALGICDAEHLKLEVGNVKIFSIQARKRHDTCFTLAEAFLDTIVFFAEGGWRCFQEGSCKPLMYGHFDLRKLEANVSKIDEVYPHVASGNVEEIGGMTGEQFETLVSETRDMLDTQIAITKDPFTLTYLKKKKERLIFIASDYKTYMLRGGMREAPYGIGIFGGSGVGKSDVTTILTGVMMRAFVEPEKQDDRFVCYMDPNDKYHSTYKPGTQVVVLDDIGNTKHDFVDTPPTEKVLYVKNNIRMAALKAEAELKGKVEIAPKIVFNTKNVKDGGASVYSNEPFSICRRDDVILTVAVKDIYMTKGMLDPEKIELHKDIAHRFDPNIPDLWDITIEKAVQIHGASPSDSSVGYEVQQLTNTDTGMSESMYKVSIMKAIQYIVLDARKFYNGQKNLVSKRSNFAKKLDVCEECSAVKSCCICAFGKIPLVKGTSIPASEPMLGGKVVPHSVARTSFRIARRYFSKALAEFFSYAVLEYTPHTAARVYARYQTLYHRPLESIVRLGFFAIPAWLNGYVLRTSLEGVAHTVRDAYMRLLKLAVCAVGSFLVLCYILDLHGFFVFAFLWFILVYMVILHYKVMAFERQALEFFIMREPVAVHAFMRDHRSNIVDMAIGCSVLATVLYWGGRKLLRAMQFVGPQGLDAVTEEQVEKMDNPEERSRVAQLKGYAISRPVPMDVKDSARTMTAEQLGVKADTNTSVFVSGDLTFQAFFICHNVCIIPSHAISPGEVRRGYITRYDVNKCGHKFQVEISHLTTEKILGYDLNLLYVPNGGSWPDLRKHFPETHNDSTVSFKMAFRRASDGLLERTAGMAQFDQKTYNGVESSPGYCYKIGRPTFNGLCCAPIIAQTTPTGILGFHIGGWRGTREREGVACSPLRADVEEALRKLRKRPFVNVCASASPLKSETMGTKVLLKEEVHVLSPVRKLPPSNNIHVFGECIGRAKYRSSVEKLSISDSVHKYLNMPREHDKPAFHLGKGFETSLSHSSDVPPGVPFVDLEYAVNDYLFAEEGLIPTIRERKHLSMIKNARVLTLVETVSGIDGLAFIDAISKNTSPGLGLKGTKKDYLLDLDPDDYPQQKPMIPNDDIQIELIHAERQLREGARINAIYKACLKDEPTTKGKEKVRVFQAAPFILQLLVRKYFLPLCRIVSLMPERSECAVGVNPFSTQWHDLRTAILRHGENVLAGDYSKYDLRMPAQLTAAALKIFVEIAREVGYSESDLRVMESLSSEIVYSIVAYNGDLVMHYGSNPSGHNLTSYVNSIVNSLLHRCAFHSIVGDMPFRSQCSIMTYGDDSKGSVHNNCPGFNHISMATYLAQHGMVFTMPDKESVPKPYLRPDECDFLKRHDVFIPELKEYRGALDESSINKSLHNRMDSAATEEALCVSALCAAAEEYFNYGRDVYDMRVAQLKQVAIEHNILSLCGGLHLTFDERVARQGVEPQAVDIFGNYVWNTRPERPTSMRRYIQFGDGTDISTFEYCVPAMSLEHCIAYMVAAAFPREYTILRHSIDDHEIVSTENFLWSQIDAACSTYGVCYARKERSKWLVFDILQMGDHDPDLDKDIMFGHYFLSMYNSPAYNLLDIGAINKHVYGAVTIYDYQIIKTMYVLWGIHSTYPQYTAPVPFRSGHLCTHVSGGWNMSRYYITHEQQSHLGNVGVVRRLETCNLTELALTTEGVASLSNLPTEEETPPFSVLRFLW